MGNIFESVDIGRFIGNLRYMGEGMLCIFIVIGAIILSICGMNAIMKKFNSKNTDE